MSSLTANQARTARSPGIRDVLRLRVELWITVVFMALAFGAGMAVGVVSQPETAPVTATSVSGGTFPVAPPLTDQQLEQGLPAGHPDLNGDTTAPAKSDKGSKGSSNAGDQNADASGAGAGAGTP